MKIIFYERLSDILFLSLLFIYFIIILIKVFHIYKNKKLKNSFDYDPFVDELTIFENDD